MMQNVRVNLKPYVEIRFNDIKEEREAEDILIHEEKQRKLRKIHDDTEELIAVQAEKEAAVELDAKKRKGASRMRSSQRFADNQNSSPIKSSQSMTQP
jgi:hypothetical protein